MQEHGNAFFLNASKAFFLRRSCIDGRKPSKRNMWHANQLLNLRRGKVEKVKHKMWNSRREQLRREWKEVP